MDDLSMLPRYDGMPIDECNSVASAEKESQDDRSADQTSRNEIGKGSAPNHKAKVPRPRKRRGEGLRKSRRVERVNVKRKPSHFLPKRDKHKAPEGIDETKGAPLEEEESPATPTNIQDEDAREPVTPISLSPSDILVDLSLVTNESPEEFEVKICPREEVVDIEHFENATFPVNRSKEERTSPTFVTDERDSIASSNKGRLSINTTQDSPSSPKSACAHVVAPNATKSGDNGMDQEMKNSTRKCVLNYPFVTVSKVATPQLGKDCSAETRLASTMLAVSVKKSWLAKSKQKQGLIQEPLSDIQVECVLSDSESELATINVLDTDDDSLTAASATKGGQLSALVAERQAKIEKEMDILINSILFKLKHQNKTNQKNEENASITCLVDEERDEKSELEMPVMDTSPGCVSLDIQKELETSLEAVVNELDVLKWPMEGIRLPTCSSQTKERRDDIMSSLKDYISDSVKSAQVPDAAEERKSPPIRIEKPTNVVSFMKNRSSHEQAKLKTQTADTENETREQEYTLGGYTMEASNYMYDDTTLEDTLDETLDYTLDETLDYTMDDTFGDYTAGTFDSSLDESRVYEQAGFKEIMKLLKVRAAHQGISEENLWGRIQSEQKKRENGAATGERTLIEV